MTTEIIKELAVVKDTAEGKCENVMLWVKCMEAKRSQTGMLYTIRDKKEYDVINKTEYKNGVEMYKH